MKLFSSFCDSRGKACRLPGAHKVWAKQKFVAADKFWGCNGSVHREDLPSDDDESEWWCFHPLDSLYRLTETHQHKKKLGTVVHTTKREKCSKEDEAIQPQAKTKKKKRKEQ